MLGQALSNHWGARTAPTRSQQVRCPAFLDALKSVLSRPTSNDGPSVDSGPDLEPDFSRWLQEHGVETDQVALRLCGREGRGLVARRRIRKGERVLMIPSHLVIDADTAFKGSSLRHVLASLGPGKGLSEWDLIAVFLTELRYHCEASAQQERGGQADSQNGSNWQALSNSADGVDEVAREAARKWSPYLSVLPTSPGTVLEWTPQQIQRLLHGSPLGRRAGALQAAAGASWLEVQPLVEAAVKAGDLPAGAVTEQGLRWALGIMLSRLVRLTPRDACGLVPWGDMANHSPMSNTHLEWVGAGSSSSSSSSSSASTSSSSSSQQSAGVAEGQGVALVADRDYYPGQQIYISYGQRSSGELLLSYGFTPPDNPHDSVTVTVGLRDNDPLKARKAVLLSQHGLPPQCHFPLRMDGLSQGLLPWAAFCAPTTTLPLAWRDEARLMDALLPGSQPAAQPRAEAATGSLIAEEQAYERVVAACQAASGAGQGEVQLPAELQEAALKELAAVCTAALKGYPLTLDEDREEAGSVNKDPLVVVCAGIRVRERQILARMQYFAATKARELARKR